ncbi:transcription factor GTE2-like isoform X1 [Actinidia eriantha]|uniref:transcription factor GTE2-like isoform X1 n=1 Tax=Actinidia eriantha TaxID=165200 RepID=UPI002583C415|nr:transcription factor GTE2-like isoform X1 [Actinidia eriantha]
MASAVLPSRNNEPYWGERKVYMRKYNNNSSTNKPHFNNLNPNPNPNNNLNPIHVPSAQIYDTSKAHQPQSHEPPSRAAPVAAAAPSDDQNDREPSHRKYLTYDLATYSRSELKELKRRLRSEIEQIRSLRAQIENRAVDYRSQFSNGDRRDRQPVPPRPPLLQVDFALQPPAGAAAAAKEKHTPKGSQKASGHKRSFPLVSGRDPKRHAALDLQIDKLVTSMMKRCEQILGKLMKHKHGWVFNKPVDADSLGLHDYHQIIKHPMDLGTVKLRLSKKEYGSPLDFASDVRLTFDNAMKYNPKGQDVYVMAEALLNLFEEMFDPAYKKFEAEQRRVVAAQEVNERIWAPPKKEPVQMVENLRRPLPESIEIAKKYDSMRVQETLAKTPPFQVEAMSVPVSMPALPSPKSAVVPRMATKLPKPKARDPNKRLMSFEEKAKLGLGLQNLPAEKMEQMLQIIKKRNSHMAPEGDEIELDIEALDNETLWELDRFVSNHKKAEGKMMRQGLMNNAVLEAQINRSPVREPTPEAVAQKSRKGDVGEEDVDIGEDIPVNNFPPVEIEKDANCGGRSSSSSSSSSSSDSSSSSGSDSGSSSGSDSEEDSVQSPFVEAKGGSVI